MFALKRSLLCLGNRTISTAAKCLAAEVQKPAPFFKGKAVVNNDITDINLANYKGKWLVLLFYPLDFTFVCPTELVAFSDRMKDFESIGCDVVGCSVDSHFSHHAFINSSRKERGLGGLNFPLLSDFTKEISKDYGVFHDGMSCSLRGLFIIDPEGVVRQMSVNDFPVGRSVDETIRIVKAFQFVEKNGEACPANWQPDTPTIKPTLGGSKEYFKNVKD